MADPEVAVAESLFSRDPANPQVAVADGYGLTVRVHHGHLVLEDGIGRHRRQRRYSRAQRTLRRLVILGHTGYITLEALRWCADVGITVLHLDSDGAVLTVHGSGGTDDARLRRAQASAPSSPVGLEITRGLLTAKLGGQAAVAEEFLHAPAVGTFVRNLRQQLGEAGDLLRCRDLEARASNAYFGAWSVDCRFAKRDAQRVPLHWTVFTARSSPLHRSGRSPRSAADPVNALLNYGYALAETECRLAALAVGLDPGLGVVHTDRKNRDSLALDLLEPVRPIVERQVLRLLAARHFRFDDFHQTRQGTCRLLAPLTHELAERLPAYARAVAHHAEEVAHLLAHASPGKIELRTPLSRSNTIAQQSRGQRSTNSLPTGDTPPTPTCRTCGGPLTDRRRKLCQSCWPVERTALATSRAASANAALATMRAVGEDPTNSPAAAAKRSASLSRRKHEELAWKPASVIDEWTSERYRAEVLPNLARLPLSALQEATGLSVSACSRIRSGKLTPHRRHWQSLSGAVMGHRLEVEAGVHRTGESSASVGDTRV